MGLVRYGPNLNRSEPKGFSLCLREFQSNLGYWETRFGYNWPKPNSILWEVGQGEHLEGLVSGLIGYVFCVCCSMMRLCLCKFGERVKSENLSCACWLLFPLVFVVLSWFVSSVSITRCCLRVLEKQSWCREMLSKEFWFFFDSFKKKKKIKQWMLCLSNVLCGV